MLHEKKMFTIQKTKNVDIFRNVQLYPKILSKTPVLTSNKLYRDNPND